MLCAQLERLDDDDCDNGGIVMIMAVVLMIITTMMLVLNNDRYFSLGFRAIKFFSIQMGHHGCPALLAQVSPCDIATS